MLKNILHVFLFKFPQVFPMSSFYTERNKNFRRVSANVELLCCYHRWWFELGPKDCTMAQSLRLTCQCWGMVLGMVSLELLCWWGGPGWKPETKCDFFFFFLPSGNEKLLKNLCTDELCCIESEIWKQVTSVPILFCFYFSGYWPLCLNCILAPQGMDLISSDNIATWIQDLS